MTIPKRDKRRRRREKSPAYPSAADKMVELPVIDRMVRRYPRVCPYCGLGGYSTICKCGRLTRFNVITK